MKRVISAREHYDRLAELGHGVDDPPILRRYMARWDGPRFYEALGDLAGLDVLEVGVGTGRLARRVLDLGCGSFTGLDVSAKTLDIARHTLSPYTNSELVLGDIISFDRVARYDVAYSVLTLMHVQDKTLALKRMVDALRPGGRIVLSIDHCPAWLDFEDWKVSLHPWKPAQYADALKGLGCDLDAPISLVDTWVNASGQPSATYGQAIATLIQARTTSSFDRP